MTQKRVSTLVIEFEIFALRKYLFPLACAQITKVESFDVFSGSRGAGAWPSSMSGQGGQSEDLRKEELLLEIHRLRERIKCLETDNASMHTKLSTAQRDVSQRLAEIEMQINDDHDFSPDNQSPEDEDEEDSEINRESFI